MLRSELNQKLCRGDCNPNHTYNSICHFKMDNEPFCQLIANAIKEIEILGGINMAKTSPQKTQKEQTQKGPSQKGPFDSFN